MVLFPWTISIRILLSNVYGASLTKGKDSHFKWDKSFDIKLRSSKGREADIHQGEKTITLSEIIKSI